MVAANTGVMCSYALPTITLDSCLSFQLRPVPSPGITLGTARLSATPDGPA
jgi:hypothetical protein